VQHLLSTAGAVVAARHRRMNGDRPSGRQVGIQRGTRAAHGLRWLAGEQLDVVEPGLAVQLAKGSGGRVRRSSWSQLPRVRSWMPRWRRGSRMVRSGMRETSPDLRARRAQRTYSPARIFGRFGSRRRRPAAWQPDLDTCGLPPFQAGTVGDSRDRRRAPRPHAHRDGKASRPNGHPRQDLEPRSPQCGARASREKRCPTTGHLASQPAAGTTGPQRIDRRVCLRLSRGRIAAPGHEPQPLNHRASPARVLWRTAEGPATTAPVPTVPAR